MMLNPNKIKNIPESNIDSYITNINLVPLNTVSVENILLNEYIDAYYKNCNKALQVTSLFNNYIKCIDIHQITSKEEFNFYKELDNIPLTKKYYYKFKNIVNIDDNTNYYSINVNIDIYNLSYDSILKNTLLSNIYLTNQKYIDSLQYNTTINLNIIFDSNYFFNFSDATTYIYSDNFHINLCGHLNCILFNDIVTYYIIRDNAKLNIISDYKFENKFILDINNNFYVEGEIDSISYNLINSKNSASVNSQECNICFVPFYDNIIFIKKYDCDNLSIIYNMIFLDNFIPVTSNQKEYNNLLLGNDYFFKSYNYFKSAKLLNSKNFETAKNYTQYLFNNNYQIETIEENNIGIVNVYSLINNIPSIIKTFPFSSIKEKFKIAATLEHSSNIHNISEYIDNEHILTDYTFTSIDKFTDIDINTEQNYIDNDSKNININNITIYDSHINNGNINHKEKVLDDHIPFHNNDDITKTFGSYENNIKTANACQKFNWIEGELISYTGNSYTTAIDEERNILPARPTINNSNISNSVITKLNNNNNEFTFIFLTSKYGYINNYFKIGDFQKNCYGKIVILEDELTSLNNIQYNVNVEEQDNEEYHNTLLHIIRYKDGKLNYVAYSDTTILAELDMTDFSTEHCNISTFDIVNYKKSKNNTLYSDTTITNPTIEDIKYYCNTVNLGEPAAGTLYNINLNKHKTLLSVPSEYGVFSNFPTNKYEIYDTWPVFIFELTIPSDCSSCIVTYDRFTDSGIYVYDGHFPDSVDLVHEFDGYFISDDYSQVEIADKEGQTVTIIIKSKYSSELPVDDEFFIKIEYNGIPYSITTELPNPYGKRKQMEDAGLFKHLDNKYDFMTCGKFHIYNQYISDWRKDKIYELYKNNTAHNTALFMD